MVTFDTNINLGQVLTFIGFIVAAMTAFYGLKGRLMAIEMSNQSQTRSLEGVQGEVKELKNVLIIMGRFDERLIALQKEVTDLRYGKGIVT